MEELQANIPIEMHSSASFEKCFRDLLMINSMCRTQWWKSLSLSLFYNAETTLVDKIKTWKAFSYILKKCSTKPGQLHGHCSALGLEIILRILLDVAKLAGDINVRI